MTYLEVKRKLSARLTEVKRALCPVLESSLGRCRMCSGYFRVLAIHGCLEDSHSKRCIGFDYTCGCTPHETWHLSKLELGSLLLEAPE